MASVTQSRNSFFYFFSRREKGRCTCNGKCKGRVGFWVWVRVSSMVCELYCKQKLSGRTFGNEPKERTVNCKLPSQNSTSSLSSPSLSLSLSNFSAAVFSVHYIPSSSNLPLSRPKKLFGFAPSLLSCPSSSPSVHFISSSSSSTPLMLCRCFYAGFTAHIANLQFALEFRINEPEQGARERQIKSLNYNSLHVP